MAEVPCAFGRGALPQLLRQIEGLAGERGAALAATLRTLVALLARQEARYDAVRLGAPALLVRLLYGFLATAPGPRSRDACAVTSLVCKALARLAAVLAGRLDLARAGGVGALAAALRAGHGMPEAAECLQAMSDRPDSMLALLAPADVIVAALVDTVRLGVSTPGSRAALACLGSLLAADRGVEHALAAGAPATLLNLAEDAAGGIACLAGLCDAQTSACSGVSDMRHDQPIADSLQQSAASALRAIAIEADGKEAVGARAAQALVRLLVGPDAGAAAAGATALRNVAEHPRARQALAAVLAGVPAAQKAACCKDLPELPAEWRYAVRAPPLVPLPVFATRDFADVHS